MGRLFQSALADFAGTVGSATRERTRFRRSIGISPVACGFCRPRIGLWSMDFSAPDETQFRYMAVADNLHGRGYGSGIFQGLESEARRCGARKSS